MMDCSDTPSMKNLSGTLSFECFMKPENTDPPACGPEYALPTEAMKVSREKLLYTIALYVGIGIQMPDYLSTIGSNPET